MESIRMNWWIVHTEITRGVDQSGRLISIVWADVAGRVRGDTDTGNSVGMCFVDLGTEDCRATATSPGQLGVRW